MPAFLLFVLVVGALAYWIWRARANARPARPGENGSLTARLRRVNDPRLAATVLMIQLVRTGTPVTAAERGRIRALMDEPLGIDAVDATFARAFDLTTDGRAFSVAADALLPLLRRRLDAAERATLIDMLGEVAGAYGEPSELQQDNIARLRRSLADADAGNVVPFGRPRGR